MSGNPTATFDFETIDLNTLGDITGAWSWSALGTNVFKGAVIGAATGAVAGSFTGPGVLVSAGVGAAAGAVGGAVDYTGGQLGLW